MLKPLGRSRPSLRLVLWLNLIALLLMLLLALLAPRIARAAPVTSPLPHNAALYEERAVAGSISDCYAVVWWSTGLDS